MDEIKTFITPETSKSPELDINNWLFDMSRKIDAVLEKQDKAIVNIAGASASGKGEATEALAKKLSAEGRSVLVISTDEFYKGISRMITEQIPQRLPEVDVDINEIGGIINRHTKAKTFNEKFSDFNLAQIKNELTVKLFSLHA